MVNEKLKPKLCEKLLPQIILKPHIFPRNFWKAAKELPFKFLEKIWHPKIICSRSFSHNLGLKQELEKIADPICFSHYPGLENLLLRYCAAIIFSFLRSGTHSLPPGGKLSVDELCKDLGVIKPYHHFIMRMIKILEEGNYVTVNGHEFQINSVEKKDKKFFQFQAQSVFPKFFPFFSLLHHCSENYAHVLSGKVPPSSVLFRPDDPHLIPNTLYAVPQVGFQQPCLEAVCKYLVLHQNENDHTNILEVGGGQGILTECLLPIIHPHKVSFCFTDIGQYFVKSAQKRWFPRYSFLNYQTLDISNHPGDQGFECEKYDVVLAFNVVHATADVLVSLSQLYKLIKPNGVLCLVEDMQPLPWIDLIYGLTKEWWEHSDGLRELSPQISSSHWKRVLDQAGFDVELTYPTLEAREKRETHHVDVAAFFCRKRRGTSGVCAE